MILHGAKAYCFFQVIRRFEAKKSSYPKIKHKTWSLIQLIDNLMISPSCSYSTDVEGFKSLPPFTIDLSHTWGLAESWKRNWDHNISQIEHRRSFVLNANISFISRNRWPTVYCNKHTHVYNPAMRNKKNTYKKII